MKYFLISLDNNKSTCVVLLSSLFNKENKISTSYLFDSKNVIIFNKDKIILLFEYFNISLLLLNKKLFELNKVINSSLFIILLSLLFPFLFFSLHFIIF